MSNTLLETYRTWTFLRNLQSNVHRPPDEIRTIQDRLLRAVVANAYQNVPFYRRFWKEMGFDPGQFRGIRDLELIPVADSSLVKEAHRQGDLLAENVDKNKCTYLDSSGSSGNPLRIWRGPVEDRVRRAVGLRIWFEHGFRWSDMTAQFQILNGPQHPFQRLGLSRKVWISTARPIEEQLSRFLESNADVVAGTPTALRCLSYAIEASGKRPKQPRIVFGAGELLDHETSAVVERMLGVKPVALYGQTEVGYVTWQCERRDSFHINADTHLVEIISDGRPARPGQLGTVTITDLCTETMPFIRYDSKDLARAASGGCPCGRGLPTIGSIEGRASSSFYLKKGGMLTTRDIVNHMAGILKLGQYRLYQEEIDRFRVELVSEATATREDARTENLKIAVSKRLREILGEVQISFEAVRPWEWDGTGKTHTVFSRVPIPAPAHVQ